MAKEIASTGGGTYINGSGNKAVDQLIDQLDKIKKSDLQHVSYKSSAEQFPVFVWAAVLLMIIDIFVLPRKIGWLKQFNFFSKEEADKRK
jgi:Ca-activated chloride channel family protein